MGKREGPAAAAAVYEFAVERFPDFAPLRISLAVELVKAGQIEDAKRVVKVACELDPDLRLVVLDHPGLDGIWWSWGRLGGACSAGPSRVEGGPAGAGPINRSGQSGAG